MKNLLGMSFDITDAVTAGEIEYLTTLTNGREDLVKNAHVASVDEVEDMPEENFALILYHPHNGLLKKYAMTDRYITELNIKMLKDKANSLPDEIVNTAASHLEKAAYHFKLAFPEELKGRKTSSRIVNLTSIDKLAWHKKQAVLKKNAEMIYALPDKKKYPLNNESLVKTAMQYFDEHANRFSLIDALEFTINTKAAAIKFNLPLSEKMQKYASVDTATLNPDFKRHLSIRKSYATEEYSAVYDQLNEKLANIPLIKVARVLEEIDKDAGLSKFWSRGIEDPIFSVYALKKEACTMHKGKKVTKACLKKLATDVIDETTLKDLQGEEGLIIFDSLPTPIKDKLIKLI